MTRRGAVTQLDKRLEQSAEGWEVTIRWSKGLTTLHQPRRSELLGREAVERAVDAQLRARYARRVLYQHIVLRLPQLSGVVILHLLLQRAGCRCRQGDPRVHDVRWRGGHGATLLGHNRRGRKHHGDHQRDRKQQALHRTPPFRTSPLKQARFQIWATSVQANLSSPAKAPIS